MDSAESIMTELRRVVAVYATVWTNLNEASLQGIQVKDAVSLSDARADLDRVYAKLEKYLKVFGEKIGFGD